MTRKMTGNGMNENPENWQCALQSSALVHIWISAININLDFTILKSPFFQKTIQLHVTLKSKLFYYIRSAVFCLGADMNLRSKHRPRFYNIKEPFLSKNYTTLRDTFQIYITLLHSLCSILPRCRYECAIYKDLDFTILKRPFYQKLYNFIWHFWNLHYFITLALQYSA